MFSEACRSPLDVSDPPHWLRAGSTLLCTASGVHSIFLSSSDCSLSILFKALEYTRGPLYLHHGSPSAGCLGQSWGHRPPGFQPQSPWRVTHVVQIWRAAAEVKTMLHPIHQVVWGVSLSWSVNLGESKICAGEAEVSTEWRFSSWFPSSWYPLGSWKIPCLLCYN